MNCLQKVSGILVASLCLGCGETPPTTNAVTGVVTLDGKPLPEVAVLFLPDRKPGQRTVECSAVTDADGKYELIYSLPTSDSNTPLTGKGATVGGHSVTVSDYRMVAESLPPPGRVPQIYTDEKTTPLRFEVKEGIQTIDIALQ